MRKTRYVLFALALVLTASASAGELRTYRCYRVSTPPRIDGLLDDEAWKSLPASNSFRNLVDGDYTAKQTYIKLGWDGAHLYIGVRCDEPEMRLISARMGDGDALWTEDSIEIFFQPEPTGGYFQFAVNSLGARVGAERAGGLTNFEAKGYHGPDFYSIEVKMPLALFGRPPNAGDMWRGDINRNIWAGGKVFSCWAPLQGSFHDTANFGRFIFDAQTATPELTASIEKSDASDKGYREALIARINDAVRKCKEYEPELAAALELPAFKAEGQEYQKQVSDYLALQASAPTASLKDLATGTRSCEDFFKKLFDFKYRVLLARLLSESDAGEKK
jgi:hypothetical protein